VLLSLLRLARAAVELAEPEVAVGDEGAHAARLGERQRLAVVGLAALGIEGMTVCCNGFSWRCGPTARRRGGTWIAGRPGRPGRAPSRSFSD
jgi:hypothetical protein